MSYTPGFAPDARSQWHALEPEIQEIALDLLEQLTLDKPPSGDYVKDALRERGGIRGYVFVHAFVDADRRTVTAVGVGYVTRPSRPRV